MVEVWRSIRGFYGLYEVSNLGRVRSLDRYINHPRLKKQFVKGRVLKTCVTKCGYVSVILSKSGKTYDMTVHRLVAEAFIPNPDGLPQVHHKDENKINNYVENLMWVPASDNINAGSRNKRVSEKLKNYKPWSKEVCQYTLDGQLIHTYNSLSEAARVNSFSKGNLGLACKGAYKQCYGFIWQYK